MQSVNPPLLVWLLCGLLCKKKRVQRIQKLSTSEMDVESFWLQLTDVIYQRKTTTHRKKGALLGQHLSWQSYYNVALLLLDIQFTTHFSFYLVDKQLLLAGSEFIQQDQSCYFKIIPIPEFPEHTGLLGAKHDRSAKKTKGTAKT